MLRQYSISRAVTITIVLFSILSDQILVKCAHWSYDHIDNWPPICASGKQQSPIDLAESSAVHGKFSPFQFTDWSKSFPATMKNNKHSVEVRLIGEGPTVKGGDLPGEFVLDHMHFHWESEHTMNGRRYPLEAHMVHYDRRYGNISMAKQKKDGLAVLGVLFNLSPDEVPDMQQLVEIIDNVGNNPDENVNLEKKIIPKYFLPCDTAGFYRYEGSLTTPGCDEVVIWTVFTNKLTLSEKQVKEFRSIQSDEGQLKQNYRPIQALNGRRLFLKVSPINGASSPSTTSLTTLILMLTTYITFSY